MGKEKTRRLLDLIDPNSIVLVYWANLNDETLGI